MATFAHIRRAYLTEKWGNHMIVAQLPSSNLEELRYILMFFLHLLKNDRHGANHRSTTPKFVMPTALSCIDTQWSSRRYELGCDAPVVRTIWFISS